MEDREEEGRERRAGGGHDLLQHGARGARPGPRGNVSHTARLASLSVCAALAQGWRAAQVGLDRAQVQDMSGARPGSSLRHEWARVKDSISGPESTSPHRAPWGSLLPVCPAGRIPADPAVGSCSC